MSRDAIFRYIDDNLDDHVEHIRSWVRQPSVSWDYHGVEQCAELVADSYRALGCSEVAIINGRFHPGVWAYFDAGAPITVHNYCMFDTRTVTASGWDFDPWGAEIVPMGPYSKVLVGRGAFGAKGPYVAFLNALQSIVAVEGTLPVNVMFLAEGDEIMGSPSYRGYVERFRHRLSDVSASYCPSSAQSGDGAVDVGLGLKGMVVLELTASGSSWGHGPRSTIHSSSASLVDSPPFRLIQAMATLTRPDGRGCAVDGLKDVWEYRKPLTDDEHALLDRLVRRFEGIDWRNVLPVGGPTNVDDLVGGMRGADPLINFLYGPTFNVAGLRSGFLGPRTSTIPFIVPSSATATLDIRLVADLEPDEIVQLVRRHLDSRGFSDIELTVFAAYGHAMTSPSHPVVRAVLDTLTRRNVEAVVWPIQAGGGPWTVVPNAFHVPCVRGGVVGGGGGAVNEYFVIEGDGNVAGLAEVEKHHVDLLYAVAEALGREVA